MKIIVLEWMVASIAGIQSPPNFLLGKILIYHCCAKIFELHLIFIGSVNYLYVMNLPCIVVTRHQHIFSFLHVCF
jgi:hypothetical protein